MKRILQSLIAVLLVAIPGMIRAEAVTSPVSFAVTAVSPVDDLIKTLNKLFALTADKELEDLTDAELNQFLQISTEIKNLKDKYVSYILTPTDKEKVVRWGISNYERLSGEKMTAADIAEMREEVNSYTTFSELTEELVVDD